MKAFQKIVAAAAVMALGGAAFAVSYSGDIQLQVGYRHEGLKADLPDDELTMKANSFEVGIQNWNLFNLTDWFSVGFDEQFSCSFGGVSNAEMDGHEADSDYYGGAFNFSFALGPAVGFKLGKVVRFQVGAGLILGIDVLKPVDDGDDYSLLFSNDISVGFALDIQAKFVPESVVSPVLGFRYAYTHASSFDTQTTRAGHDTDSTVDESCSENAVSLYLGLSINWGKRKF